MTSRFDFEPARLRPGASAAIKDSGPRLKLAAEYEDRLGFPAGRLTGYDSVTFSRPKKLTVKGRPGHLGRMEVERETRVSPADAGFPRQRAGSRSGNSPYVLVHKSEPKQTPGQYRRRLTSARPLR